MKIIHFVSGIFDTDDEFTRTLFFDLFSGNFLNKTDDWFYYA